MDRHSVTFQTREGAAALTYGGLRAWDAENQPVDVRFSPGGGETRISISIDDSHAVYPITIDPIAQQAYLKASNTDLGDTLVVGDMLEDSAATGVGGNQSNTGATEAGAAFVFVRSGTSWSQQAYLKASNTGTNDNFGFSVSLSGSTAIMGAYSEDSPATGVNGDQISNTGSESGAAYVFALGPPPVAIPIVITECFLTGTDFTIHFTGEAGVTDWRVMGSADLASFPDDRTAGSSIIEASPGIYEVLVDLGDAPASYFLRIER